MNVPKIGIYCPSCGQEFEHEPVDIAPAVTLDWTCPSCGTEFEVVITYNPKHNEGD